MKLMKALFLFFAILPASLANAQSESTPPRILSDSLVENLPCDRLTPENVLTFVRKDAFNTFRQIPINNWSSGPLQVCWALSLAQRDLFYLTRFGVQDAPERPLPETVQYILDLVGSRSAETPRKVFSIRDEQYYRFDKNLWDPPIFAPFLREFASGQRAPTQAFRSEIEDRQTDSFFSFGNFPMILGNRARSEETNQETLREILKQMDQGRMPLVILRAQFFAQHVVLLKSVEKKADGSYSFTIYDSAQPFFDQSMEYRNHQFYGGKDVIFRFDRFSDYKDPVGVFLTNDPEMDALQQANYEYYSNLCGM